MARKTAARTHATPGAPSRPRLRTDVRIAPFLSSRGGLMILATDYAGTFFSLGEVTGIEGGEDFKNGVPEAAQLCSEWEKIPLGKLCRIEAAWSLLPQQGEPVQVAQFIEAKLLPRGAHRAPWRLMSGESVLIAIDALHRLVATMTIPDDIDETDVQRELLMILEAHEAGAVEEVRDA